MSHLPINSAQKAEAECSETCRCGGSVDRRNFLKIAGGTSVALLSSGGSVMAGPFENSDFEKLVPSDKKLSPAWVKSLFDRGTPRIYKGAELKYIGMPVGGICAGQMYLGGDGKLWHWGIFNQHRPTGDAGYRNPAPQNSSISQGFALHVSAGGKSEVCTLDRSGFSEVSFRGEYPIGMVQYSGSSLPITVALEAFSPFIPLSVDDSSLPATVMRFTVKNNSRDKLEATLFGWLENAVCHNHRTLAGKRSNTVLRGNGHSFLSCSAGKMAEQAKDKQPDILFEDWNKATYEGWTVEGTAFGNGPIKKSEMPNYQGDVGGDTARVVNSHATAPGKDVGVKDSAVGRLLSRTFVVGARLHQLLDWWRQPRQSNLPECPG